MRAEPFALQHCDTSVADHKLGKEATDNDRGGKDKAAAWALAIDYDPIIFVCVCQCFF